MFSQLQLLERVSCSTSPYLTALLSIYPVNITLRAAVPCPQAILSLSASARNSSHPSSAAHISPELPWRPLSNWYNFQLCSSAILLQIVLEELFLLWSPDHIPSGFPSQHWPEESRLPHYLYHWSIDQQSSTRTNAVSIPLAEILYHWPIYTFPLLPFDRSLSALREHFSRHPALAREVLENPTAPVEGLRRRPSELLVALALMIKSWTFLEGLFLPLPGVDFWSSLKMHHEGEWVSDRKAPAPSPISFWRGSISVARQGVLCSLLGIASTQSLARASRDVDRAWALYFFFFLCWNEFHSTVMSFSKIYTNPLNEMLFTSRLFLVWCKTRTGMG